MGLSQLPGVSPYSPNTIPYEVNIGDTRFGGGFQEHKRRVRIACEPQSLEPREIEKAATRDQSQNQEPTPKSKRSIDPKRPCSEETTGATLKSLRLSVLVQKRILRGRTWREFLNSFMYSLLGLGRRG